MSINEQARLGALQSYDVLDTPEAEPFDRIVRLAADMFGAPIAAISLIDSDRQWFKARIGLDTCQTPRGWAFCAHAIELLPNATLVVEDATRDARFADNPLVTGGPKIRFYAGAVLTDAQGHNLGTLCVIDSSPRPHPSAKSLEQLRTLAGIAMDELDLLRTRAAFEKKSRLLNLAEEMAGVGHWRHDLITGKVLWSDEVYRIFGVERATYDHSFENAIKSYPSETRAAATKRFHHAIETGEGYQVRQQLLRPDGMRRDVIIKAETETNSSGRVTALVGVFQDITEHVQAVREAKQASKAKADFLANMSHEIRTPLTSVIGFADLLAEHESLDETAKGFAAHVRNGGRTLLGLINDVLDYSKLESGHKTLSPVPANMAELAGEVFELLSFQAKAKGLTLELSCSAQARQQEILVDQQSVRQLLVNLIGNAIKFTPAGFVRLQISLSVEEHPDFPNHLRCRVVDSGEGIPENQLESVFERFSQGDASIGKRHGGTGLGLAICKGLVEAMAGQIGVQSEPGKGSTFWFEIPAELSCAGRRAEQAPAMFDINRRSVLVVDDNETNRSFARAALEVLGVHVVEAQSGEKAVELAADMQFDLILMDIRMPGMGGTAAMHAIRKASPVRYPIVAFTAEGEQVRLDELAAEGFHDILCKPLVLSELQSKVAQIILAPSAGRRNVA